MKKVYLIILLGVISLVSCGNDDDNFPVAPIYDQNYLIVNGFNLPVNAAEIEYLGRDVDGRDVFDLAITEQRFLNIYDTHTDQFILTRLHANYDYYTPEGYYNFNRFNSEIEFVDYAEDVDVIRGDFFADYYTGDFSRAEVEIFYLGNNVYTISGKFKSIEGDNIVINYTGPIYDYTDNGIGIPLKDSSGKNKKTSIKERRKIQLKK